MAFYASGFTGLTAAAFTGITGVMQNFQLVLFLVQVANTPHSWREVSKVLNKQEKSLDVTGSAHKTHVFFSFLLLWLDCSHCKSHTAHSSHFKIFTV